MRSLMLMFSKTKLHYGFPKLFFILHYIMSYPEIRERLISLIKKEYGFLNYYEELIDFLQSARYPQVDAELANALQKDLRNITHDNHFSVTFMKERELFNIYETPKDGGFTYKITRNTAYLKIREFCHGETATNKYLKMMENIIGSGVKSLTIDLRKCPGGYIDACQYFLSFFIPANTTMFWLYQPLDAGNETNNLWYYKSKSELPKYKGHVTVIIDNKTFSGAQIVTWAFKKWLNARIIGKETMRWSHTSPVYKGITVGDSAFKFAIPNSVVMEKHGSKYSPINFDGIKPDDLKSK